MFFRRLAMASLIALMLILRFIPRSSADLVVLLCKGPRLSRSALQGG